MASPRTLAELLASRSNVDLRRGGREVGYAMVRRSPAIVDELRDTVDGGGDTSDDFARGYRAALADALSGFAAALDSHLEVERAAAAIGRRDAQVLRSLLGEARPQVRIARELAMPAHDVSRAAKRLRAAGLVKAYPGLRETEQLHRVTALGRAVVRELDARASLDSDVHAAGTPPIAETPLYAEEPAWSPAAAAAAAAPGPRHARAASPELAARGGDVHELDTASDRWRSRSADEDE